MARPHKAVVDYFPHYVNHKRTMFFIEARFGNDGYAFWFKLLELLGSTENHYIDCNNFEDWEFLLAKTRVSENLAIQILNLLAKLESIDSELWENKIIWSENFVENLQTVYKRREVSVYKKSDIQSFCIQKPHLNGVSVNNNPTENELEGVSVNKNPQSKVKESKVKKSKEKEEEETSPDGEAPPRKNLIDELLKIFGEEFENSRGFEYSLVHPGKERQAVGDLLKNHKLKNKDSPLDTEQTITAFRTLFKKALSIKDNWHFEKMSPSHISSNLNEIKVKLAKNGSSSYKPASYSDIKARMKK